MTPLGHLIRLPLRLIPPDAVMPVLSGPNRGYKWVAGSSNHGCWIGWYDRETQGRLVYSLRPGDVAYDIGANAGFFTLLMARCVGPSGHVHAFEPLPENVAALKNHVVINGLSNVTVHPVAVTDHSGMATFRRGANSSQGFVSETGDLTVRCVAIDDLDLPLPRTIKMDIEGGEGCALAGMPRTLRHAKPYLIIEPHI